MDLNEKIDRIVRLLNICPVCLSGYMKISGYSCDGAYTRRASGYTQYTDRTWNEYDTLRCTSCFHLIQIENPNYIPPEKRVMPKKTREYSSDEEEQLRFIFDD